jgi:hypothetical protein
MLFANIRRTRIKCLLTFIKHDFVKNRFWFETKTLRLKLTKVCYRCIEVLDYLIIMTCELAETNIESKQVLKLVLKAMFIYYALWAHYHKEDGHTKNHAFDLYNMHF